MADKFKKYGVPVRLENTPIFKELLGSFLEKKKTSGGGQYVYGFLGDTQNSPQVSNSATTGASIVARLQGRIRCADPVDNADAATKAYVDAAIAALKAELTK